MQELLTALQQIRELLTSVEGSKILIKLRDENTALEAAMKGKHAEFSQQISKGMQQ